MKAKYKHTNIIAADWHQLARFYQEVFNCIIVPPERELQGEWLEKGTGVAQAQFTGEGIMHLAFEVDDVEKALDLVLKHSGKKIGEVTSSEVNGVGLLTFVYCADPEGNIIELQAWSKRAEPKVSLDRSRSRRTL
jgi:predicted enzyme related to lactoylglutathione lyase